MFPTHLLKINYLPKVKLYAMVIRLLDKVTNWRLFLTSTLQVPQSIATSVADFSLAGLVTKSYARSTDNSLPALSKEQCPRKCII